MSKTAPFTRLLALTVLVAVSAWACSPKHGPRAAVDRFIAAHYIDIDLKATEPLCTGLALEKIRDEIRLTQGQMIDASTRKPTIYYKLKAEQRAADHVSYLFVATIEVPDGGSFKKKWMITARQEGGKWMISNYSEYD